MNKILQGDCLIKLKELEDNSVDSIVTDPPYELGFMGKSWDNTGIANNKDMWAECLRVLKPGGYLLSFGGTRTYHRMASAIEDAGFEVRDMIEWVYGSGFPKSLNIGKAVDKIRGNEREVIREEKEPLKQGGNVNWDMRSSSSSRELTKGTSEWEGWGTALKPAHEPICMARKPLAEKTVAENVLKYGTGGINIDESRVGTEIITQRLATVEGGKAIGGKGVGIKQKATGETTTTIGRFPANLIHDNSEEVRECFPETGSVKGRQTQYSESDFAGDGGWKGEGIGQRTYDGSGNASRFFKNIPLSQKDLWIPEILRQPGFILEDGTPIVQKINGELIYKTEGDSVEIGTKDSEKSSEFSELQNPKSIIYQAKASKSERNKGMDGLEAKPMYKGDGSAQSLEIFGSTDGGREDRKNNHPTVKPIALMEYLIKMVTPKGGIVLDPFAGSGSTLVAAKENGYQYIGIEMTPEYIPIIEARLKSVENTLF